MNKRKLKQELKEIEMAILPEVEEYPGWVDEMASWWPWNNFGGLESMAMVYGLKQRSGEPSHKERLALQMIDGQNGWTSYLIKFGNSEIKRLYSERGRFDSEGWQKWEELVAEFREAWLGGGLEN